MKLESNIIPDLVTLANGFVGLLAIMYIMDGEYRFGSALILSGVLIDGADGYLARAFRKDMRHGIFMDSIADMVTFCFAPSILLYGMYYDLQKGTSFESAENALVVTASMLVVLLGILRLARFIEKEHKEKQFVGLPTPASAVVIVLCAEVIGEQFAVLFTAIIISLLMISKIKYPKLSGILSWTAGFVIIIGIFAIWITSPFSTPILIFTSAMAIIYVVIGPLYAHKEKR
jgi:CDP-diacylglycerol--serine O-phosphatidyltransferase